MTIYKEYKQLIRKDNRWPSEWDTYCFKHDRPFRNCLFKARRYILHYERCLRVKLADERDLLSLKLILTFHKYTGFRPKHWSDLEIHIIVEEIIKDD